MKSITVFYAPACPFSQGTLAFLAVRGADYRVVNLDQHDDERARLSQRVEKLETPTLEVAGELLVAPSLSDLQKKLAEWGLPEEASPFRQLKDCAE